MKKIIIVCDSYERFDFFYRLYSSLSSELYKIIIITDKFGIWLQAKRKKITCYMTKSVFSSGDTDTDIDLNNTLEIKLDITNKHNAILYYQSFYKILTDVNNIYGKIDVIFIWNGSGIVGSVIRDFCQAFQIKKCFFEISNLPGKIFVDPNGVNAQSSIFFNPNLLDEYEVVSDEEYSAWVEKYKIEKSNKGVPQAKKARNINYYGIFDILFKKITHKPDNDSRTIYKRFESKLKSKKIEFIDSDYDYINNEYIFLPFQVCNDSQIKINSNVNNEQALNIAYEYARSRSFDLLIKIHPAETNVEFIKYIKEFIRDKKIYISTFDSNELILRSNEIFVINSTVGLEAMILDKKVNVLGNAIYKNMNNEYLKKFIFHYLINIDYFSDDKIDKSLMDELMARI
ncbi:capsular polysaccharide export protein, LipB/KpsS family [Photobacterium leiognathi]|uniref:capsular polysaccharide export protein, LipB/KpsS family n=1 Tax=Photobacterium leiognathi TaxID=553611 RepID=UPI0029826ED3|nr:hypothetical protein [Photobacterium leiognathi]